VCSGGNSRVEPCCPFLHDNKPVARPGTIPACLGQQTLGCNNEW
jgi:hypothetical protein